MAAIGGILALVASLGMLVFGIQILIKAFQQSIWWQAQKLALLVRPVCRALLHHHVLG